MDGRGAGREGRSGARFEIALYSPVAGGIVRTWRRGMTQLWRVSEPEHFAALTSRGLVMRAPVRSGVLREGCLLHAERGLMVLSRRFPAQVPADPAGEPAVLALEPVATPPPGAWDPAERFDEVFQQLADALHFAGRRGEAVGFGPGGWDGAVRPSCTVSVLDRGEGPRVFVEADPAPRGGRMWGDPPPGVRRWSVDAPAAPRALPGAALHLLECLDHWGLPPWDVGISYIPYTGLDIAETAEGVRYALDRTR